MEFLTNEKLTIVGAAGMIGSNMAQTAIMMHLTPNICLYDPYAPGLEGVAEEMFHCGFEGMNITFTSDIKEALHEGMVITIPPEVKHWHGAKGDSWFSHIAMEVPGENASNEWCEPVRDADYNALEEEK